MVFLRTLLIQSPLMLALYVGSQCLRNLNAAIWFPGCGQAALVEFSFTILPVSRIALPDEFGPLIWWNVSQINPRPGLSV
jgi:hypothetical protein